MRSKSGARTKPIVVEEGAGYPGSIRTVTVKPLAGDMDGGLAHVGCLDTKLVRMKDSAGVACDEINRDIACQPTGGFPNG